MRRSLRSIESEGEGEPYHGIGSLLPEALSSRTGDSGLPSRRAAEAVGIDQQYDGDPQCKDECCENQQQWDLPFGFEVDGSCDQTISRIGRIGRCVAPAAKARWDLVESLSRFSFLFEHDLFGKPVSTFPDHALSHALANLYDGQAPECSATRSPRD